MARKSIKQKSIEHYDRVIEYAKKSKEKNATDMLSNMLDDTRESIGSKHCAYCKKNDFDNLLHLACLKCKLHVEKYERFNCCNGLYVKMTDSKTTKTFIKRAEAVKQYIIDNG